MPRRTTTAISIGSARAEPAWSGTASLARRAFDIAFSAAALIVLIPAFATIVLVMRFRDPGPVFFGHIRVGKGGRRFRCWKFRTMVPNAHAAFQEHLAANPAARQEWCETRKLKLDPRVTELGQLLRKTSLDELPQFFNVLIGEMSVVGPRPVVAEELEKYGDAAPDYLSAKPGITGLWQVSGRSDIDYAARVALDLEYLRTRNIVVDLNIILRTIGVLLGRRGSY